MRVRVIGGVGDLARDLAAITRTARRDMATVVGDNLREGRDQARTFARATARRHGKHYPRSITVDRTSPLSGEYGPDPSLKQGGMSFEGGSRNQPPHNDLARSADVIGPQFGDDVADLPDRWFW